MQSTRLHLGIQFSVVDVKGGRLRPFIGAQRRPLISHCTTSFCQRTVMTVRLPSGEDRVWGRAPRLYIILLFTILFAAEYTVCWRLKGE